MLSISHPADNLTRQLHLILKTLGTVIGVFQDSIPSAILGFSRLLLAAASRVSGNVFCRGNQKTKAAGTFFVAYI
jgi:hypothetical protein